MTDKPLWAYTEACDDKPARTVEETFEFHGAYARLFDYNFGAFASGFASDLVTLGPSDSWANDTITLNATGTTAEWLPRWLDVTSYDDLPLNTVVEFETTANATCGGIILRENFAIVWDDTMIGGMYYTTSSQVVQVDRPGDYSGKHHWRVAVKEMQVTTDEDDWRVFLSVWMDGAWQLTYSYDLSQPGYGDKDIAFLVWDDTGDVAEYTNLVISELSEPVIWEIMDIGSPPAEGLKRVLDGRYVRWLVRYDGTIKAWRPKATSASSTISEADVIDESKTRDFRVVNNHNRQIGGWYETDALDEVWYNKLGHKFGYNNNPVIDTEVETWDVSERVINESLEQYRTANFSIQGNPLIEAEDHISVNSEDWIVDAVSHEVGPGLFITHLSCRSYINAS